MAKEERHPFERGPYLAAAVLCERVLTEKDGVNSLIRIVDRITHTATGPEPPLTLQPFKHTFWLYVSFKSGSARGVKDLSIRIQKPSGDSPPALTLPVNFEGEDDRGANVAAQLELEIDVVGVWWFDISLDSVHVTKLPLRIIYMPQKARLGPPGQGDPPG
jgi:hypothetical protein